MADEQSMSVKAYLDVGGGRQEVRRFGMPEALPNSFSCLKEKVCNIFNLGRKDITLAWKDSEDDLIVISSDKELADAIDDCLSKQKMQVFRINITLGIRALDFGSNDTVPGNQQGDLHKGVICNSCGGLCETKGMHDDHKMMRTPKPPAKGEPSFTGHFGRHGGRRCNRSGWCGRNCARGAGAGGTGRCWQGQGHATNGCLGQQQQQQQQEKPQQKEKQQQQESANNCDKDKECPWTSTTNGPCPFAEAGHFPIPSPERVVEEVQYATQEAQKMAHHVADHFATQMASNQVANVMRDIWTWSGQQQQEKPQQKEKQQQQESANNCDKDKECPWTFAEAGNFPIPSPERVAEEIQYAVQEVQKKAHHVAHHFATPMTSDQVANVMRGIWTAWSGQQVPGVGPTTTSSTLTATASSSSSSSANNKENNQYDETNGSKDQQAKNTNNSTSPTNNSTNPAPHEQFLRTTGENITRMLEPLGIDVDVSVENNGIQHCSLSEDDVQSHQSPTCKSPNASTPPPPRPLSSTPVAAATRANMEVKTEGPEQSPSGMEVPVGSPPEADSQMHSDVEEWTLVNRNSQSPGRRTQSRTKPTAPPMERGVEYPSLSEFQTHPDPSIQEAVTQMQSMGYKNEGGWLTNLLEMKEGDINQVLDLLQPIHKL